MKSTPSSNPGLQPGEHQRKKPRGFSRIHIHFNHKPLAGTRFGLIEKDDSITWKARHLFKNRLLRVRMTEMSKPNMFTDEQSQGDFKSMKHEHHFKPCDNGTIMIDLFHYEVPYGTAGRWFNSLYLGRYVKKLLELRNKTIKEFAETDRWKKLLVK